MNIEISSTIELQIILITFYIYRKTLTILHKFILPKIYTTKLLLSIYFKLIRRKNAKMLYDLWRRVYVPLILSLFRDKPPSFFLSPLSSSFTHPVTLHPLLFSPFLFFFSSASSFLLLASSSCMRLKRTAIYLRDSETAN